jgi:hypothetical protein
MPYREREMSYKVMLRFWICLAVAVVLSSKGGAQQSPSPLQPSTGSTVIGCLTGPDSDGHYTLTSMQHRSGVDVVGGDQQRQSDALKQGAGAKVKLTGTWETIPGSEGKKGDTTRRFKATDVVVMNQKCEAPTQVTPLSKKKQAQQAQQQQTPDKK